MKYLLAHDLGTTGTKRRFSMKGNIVSSFGIRYPLPGSWNGRAERRRLVENFLQKAQRISLEGFDRLPDVVASA